MANLKLRVPPRWASRKCLTLGLVLVCVGLVLGSPALAKQSPQAQEAHQGFRQAQKVYQERPDDATAAWQFARSCFHLAEYATNKTERATIADLGLAACRKALEGASNSAPLQYYLALNLGQRARTRSLGALKLVDQMEAALLAAIALDPGFDHAGPHRILGLLYRDAPSLASVGDRAKARRHLERSVELAPLYLDNRLNLAESCLQWGDRATVRKELKEVDKTWVQAKAVFAGPEWAAAWDDWDTRREALKRKLHQPARPQSPGR